MADHQYNPNQECWKEFNGFPGYEISDHGRIRSFWKGTGNIAVISDKPQRILKLNLHSKKNGYLQACLKIKGKVFAVKIHRAVLETFVSPCPIGYESRHLDGDNCNNHLYNLTWGTPKENQADRVTHGTASRGDNHAMSRLNSKRVYEIRKLYKQGDMTNRALALIFQIAQSTIWNVVNMKTWKHPR